MNINIQLFLSFCKIGALMFGGGLAMIPVLENEVVKTRNWMTEDEMMDMYAIAQCTPGVIAVNTATKCGYKVNGICGALAATIGVIFIPFICIIAISVFIKNFAENEIIRKILMGIRIAACGMTLNTLVNLLKARVKDKTSIIIVSIAFVLLFVLNIANVWIIVSAIILGILFTKTDKGGESKDAA